MITDEDPVHDWYIKFILDYVLWARETVPHRSFGDQVIKIGEEYGELCEAWSLHRGTNPRKPAVDDLEPVLSELADVIVAAMVAIVDLGRDPNEVLGTHWAKIAARRADMGLDHAV